MATGRNYRMNALNFSNRSRNKMFYFGQVGCQVRFKLNVVSEMSRTCSEILPEYWGRILKLAFTFQSTEESLPICSPNSVCNKIDTYGSPWVEKQCKCPGENYQCSSSLHTRDGHTIVDRNRQYKVLLQLVNG